MSQLRYSNLHVSLTNLHCLYIRLMCDFFLYINKEKEAYRISKHIFSYNIQYNFYKYISWI